MIASVTGWAQNEHLQLTGSFPMGIAIGVATFDLAASDGRTLGRCSFRAIGAVDADVAEAMARGWAELVGSRLKPLGRDRYQAWTDADRPSTIRSIT